MGDEDARRVRARVNRIAGQVAGVGRMVDEGRPCGDVLVQIAAARSALDALGVELLSGHLEACVLGQGTHAEHEHEQAPPMTPDQRRAEFRALLTRFLT